MFLYKQREAVEISEKLNAALSANNLVTSITNNPWNSIVGVNLTSQTKLASQINALPKGLLKIVAEPGEAVQASPLPSKDYLVSKSFYIKDIHEIKSSQIRKLYGQKILDLFTDGANLENEEAKVILQSQDFSEILNEQIDACINSLTGKFKYTVAKLAGDALSGSVTLNGDRISETFLFDKAEVTAASPLWEDVVNSKPFDDMERVNNDLKALKKNQYNGLRFGSTLVAEDTIGHLLQNPTIKDAIRPSSVGDAMVDVATLNSYLAKYAIPTFGKLNVDYANVYVDEDANGEEDPKPVFNPNYIYSASNTELPAIAGGIPNTPIVISLTPADLTGLPAAGAQSTNREGVSTRIIRVEPRKDGEELMWQVVAVARVAVSQYRPFARMQVLTV